MVTAARAKPKSHTRIVVRPPRDPHKLAPRSEIRRGSLLILSEADRLLRAFPDRVAPLIEAEPDRAKWQAILDREVRRMVRKLEATKNAMVDRLYSTEH